MKQVASGSSAANPTPSREKTTKSLSSSLQAKGIKFAGAAVNQANRIGSLGNRLSTPHAASVDTKKEALAAFLHNILGTAPQDDIAGSSQDSAPHHSVIRS